MRLQIDDYKAQGPNAIVLLSIASIAAELANSAEILTLNSFFASSSGLSLREYLDPDRPSRIQIKKGNAGEDFVAAFIVNVFKDLRAKHVTLHASQSPKAIFSCLPELELQEKNSSGADCLSVRTLLRFDSLSTMVDLFCRKALDFKHPRLPCLAFSLPALKCRLLGIARNTDDTSNTGLFAVIREARGHRAKKSTDRNIIVRDAIFIKQSPEANDYDAYYYSAIDKLAYCLERVSSPVSGKITLSGKLFERSEKSAGAGHLSLKVDFRRRTYDFPLQHRESLITGETRQRSRVAAWKSLLVRPEWSDLATLESNVVAIDNPADVANYLSDVAIIGVLFRRNSGSDATELVHEMESRRRAFRELIYSTGASERAFTFTDSDRNYFESEFKRSWPKISKLASRKKGRKNNATDFSTLIVSRLEALVADYWPYIEPAQLVMRKDERLHQRHSDISKEDQERLLKLVTRQQVIAYGK